MTGVTEATPLGARFVHWANLYLFSLNLAWMTTFYNGGWIWIPEDYWPRFELRFLFWKTWIPDPHGILSTLGYALALSVPIFLILLLMARARLARICLRAFAGAFAIVGYPSFALRLTEYFLNDTHIAGHEFGLLLETVAVLGCGVLYYLRRWHLPTGVSVLLLLVHFSLWAWVTHCYASPFTESALFRHHWDVVARIEIWLGICFSMMLHYSFPVIGFLSALSSGLELKLSSPRLPLATWTAP
ncbi:MAG: hypothetical protein P4N24_11840 [Acidobacteriota bacterium]|nr:hypothetical protein [Acidobacteriota bacterium]